MSVCVCVCVCLYIYIYIYIYLCVCVCISKSGEIYLSISFCNIMAEGFRFMPLGLVRLRTFRLSAWVT